MSGSGAAGEVPGGDTGVPCDRLVFETTLQSVQRPAAAGLRPPDLLVVRREEDSVVAEREGHGIVGAIISQMPRLLRCLEEGNTYQAEVLEIELPRIKVRVSST